MGGFSYPIPIFLPRRRRIATPGEWLREKIEEQRREREATITRAIALSDDLGTSSATDGFTTEAAADTDTLVVVCMSWYDDTKSLIDLTDDGDQCVWQIDAQHKQDANGHRVAIVSGYATSGLAIGRVLTPTFSGGGTVAFPGGWSVSSWTGIASSSYVEDWDFEETFSLTWTVPSLTVTGGGAESLLIGLSRSDWSPGPGSHTPGGGSAEIHAEFDAFGGSGNQQQTDVWDVVTANSTITGSWSGSGFINAHSMGVAYKGSGGAPPPSAPNIAVVQSAMRQR